MDRPGCLGGGRPENRVSGMQVPECLLVPTGKPGWLLPCGYLRGSGRVTSFTEAHPRLPQVMGRAQGSC